MPRDDDSDTAALAAHPPVLPDEIVSATYIHAARIDESGLRALARRAREQAQFQAVGQDTWSLAEGPPLPLPGSLCLPEWSDAGETSRSRRSA